jgi:para-aminobenzoate synthetase component I
VSTGARVRTRELTAIPRRDGIVDVDTLLAQLDTSARASTITGQGPDPAAQVGPGGPCVDLLESADRSGWTFLVPHDLAPALLVDDGVRTTLIGADGRTEDLGTDPLTALDEVAARLALDPCAERDATSVPFTGGLLGAFAYELGDRILPRLPRRTRDAGQLDLLLRVVGVLVAIPRERDRVVAVADATILAATWARPMHLAGTDPAGAALDLLAARCAPTAAGDRSGTLSRAPGPVGAQRGPHAEPRTLVTTSLPPLVHAAAVQHVQARIAAGDVYQVNVAQRLEARFAGGLHELHRRLRAVSPASHAALLPAAGLVSASPERFLDVSAGRVLTEPIKGTRPRSDDPELDAALADDLATAAKDRAENVMVVDLERNDLGQVCEPGSVRVDGLLELRALPTVWHLVSSVRGTLRSGTTYGRLLRATFPSGSVTGAPRLAAMQAIRALEPVPRGWYCGAVGFLGRGSAALSVAIRTATLDLDGTVRYGAGGGIVADSVPDDEVAESLDKAVAFLRAVGATRVDPSPVRPGRADPASETSTIASPTAPHADVTAGDA